MVSFDTPYCRASARSDSPAETRAATTERSAFGSPRFAALESRRVDAFVSGCQATSR